MRNHFLVLCLCLIWAVPALGIIESYLPMDAKTPNHTRDRRLRVTVSLKDIHSEVVDDGLHYDVERDIYYIP